MPRYFTVEEANQALTVIRPLIQRVLEIRKELLDKRPELAPLLEQLSGNGGSRAGSQAAESFIQLERLFHQVQETGVEIKDINTGLLDFRSLREGREIYLCWQYDEDQVRFWHELDDGYPGRQPLD